MLISPVAATVVTFWALLVTGYAKSRAASTTDVVEWREHYAGGRVCVGECVSDDADAATLESVACGAYDASVYGTTRKFERPEGVGGTCQWFPVDPSLPGSGLDFGAVLVYCNFVTQLACGAFLVFFGSLGDFSSFRKRGLVMGWLAFSIAPLVAGFVSPGNEDDPANANKTQQTPRLHRRRRRRVFRYHRGSSWWCCIQVCLDTKTTPFQSNNKPGRIKKCLAECCRW